MAEQRTVEGGLDEPEELEPPQGSLALAAPEDRWTRADWERAAAAVLRKQRRLGQDEPDELVWDRLTRTTLDGIGVTPLGIREHLDQLTTAGRPTRTGAWDIRVHLAGDDARRLNEEALADLEGGATSLWLDIGPDTDLATALDGVLLDLAPVVLDAADGSAGLAESFLRYAGDRPLHRSTNLGADPLGAALRAGPGVDLDRLDPVDEGRQTCPEEPRDEASRRGPSRNPRSGDVVRRLAQLAHERGILGVLVDATAVHELGGSDAQELGWSMAVAAEYLRQLTASGLTVEQAAGLVEFRYAATDEQFPTIAKLRAARRLWARVLELSGVSTSSTAVRVRQRQHAVTSRPMTTKYDPYVNLLRGTVAAFAAGVGGADAVTVLPFDTPLGRPDAFGRRIARNTSHLLIAESHLGRVADPAGGAYAVEKLTDDLAHAAWAELGRIEEAGGASAALADGSLRARIDETARRRQREIATRKRPITGLTEFPNPDETLPEREPDPATARVRRYGASFEALRDEPADRPVFLATLGSVADHTARATFARNLLAAGGIRTDEAGPTASVEDLLAAYAGQRVVCLAGPDPAYAEWGAAAVTALREAGAHWVVVAGVSTLPFDGAQDKQQAQDGAGSTDVEGVDVDDSFALGDDAIAFLRRTRERLAP